MALHHGHGEVNAAVGVLEVNRRALRDEAHRFDRRGAAQAH